MVLWVLCSFTSHFAYPFFSVSFFFLTCSLPPLFLEQAIHYTTVIDMISKEYFDV